MQSLGENEAMVTAELHVIQSIQQFLRFNGGDYNCSCCRWSAAA